MRNREIGFIFQSFNLIGDLTVYENVELPAHLPRHEGRRAEGTRHGGARESRHVAPREAPAQPALRRSAAARRRGPRRRRFPSILLADEPTGNLDSKNGEAVMELLRELHREGATICMVTHDPRYARSAERSIHLFDGRVVEEDAAKSGLKDLEESGFHLGN